MEERKNLERKKEVLEGQMKEGKMLKEKIERRSQAIEAYFEHYLGGEQRNKFERYLRCKVKICIETRELEEMIRICETLAEFVNKISEHY